MIATSKEPIREFGGRIIGWLESDGSGKQQIRDFGGRILGSYDPHENVTREFGGRIVGQGNLLMMFLNFSK